MQVYPPGYRREPQVSLCGSRISGIKGDGPSLPDTMSLAFGRSWGVDGTFEGKTQTPAHVHIEKSRHLCPISRSIRATERVDSGYVFNPALLGRCDDNCN
jgi:hypothetical protein